MPPGRDYIPALDGMRAVSVMLVVLSHFAVRMAPGLLGVTVFFFISGYLITGQLLSEIDRTGAISLRLFYIRRVLRLYPALIAMLAAGLLTFSLIGGRITSLDTASALFYFVNILEIFRPLASGMPGVPHPFGVLWSLAVEEHYYLFFPLLALALARRRGAFILAMLGLIAAVTIWRFHVATLCDTGCTILRVEHGTDTRIDSILYGAVLASLLASKLRPATLRLISTWQAALVGAFLIVSSLLVRDPWFRQTLRFSIQGIGLFLLVGAVLYAPALAGAHAVLENRLAVRVGRWSYSLYLWHWLVLCAAMALLPPWAAAPLVDAAPSAAWFALVFAPLLAASFALAAASYYGIERPMLRVRRAFGSRTTADQPGPKPAHKSLFAAAPEPRSAELTPQL